MPNIRSKHECMITNPRLSFRLSIIWFLVAFGRKRRRNTRERTRCKWKTEWAKTQGDDGRNRKR